MYYKMSEKVIIESDNKTEIDSHDINSGGDKYTCPNCPEYKKLLDMCIKKLYKWEEIAEKLISSYEARKSMIKL